MGVKKLFTFLNNNSIYKIYPYMKDLLSDLKLKKSEIIIGIDGNLYTYKYLHSYDNMLIGFYNQIINFLSSGIIPFYIFDGGTLNEKESTNNLRSLKKTNNKIKLNYLEENIELMNEEYYLLKNKFEKNILKITKEDMNKLLELFDLLNIPYIFAHGEGEYLAVLLNKLGIIDLILTDDTDPIPAGAKHIVKFYNNNVYYLDVVHLLLDLDLTKLELIDYCILMGNDYINLNHGLKPNDLYKMIKKYSSIENIIKENQIEQISSEKLDLIEKIRKIYLESPDNERNMFIDPKNYKNVSLFQFIDLNDYNNYSNIILEYWDDFINIFKSNQSDNYENVKLKIKINKHIRKKKFNIKNIIKFLKNYISDMSPSEISNTQTTFEYLNTFGF
jgi:5'-3' exonuclease